MPPQVFNEKKMVGLQVIDFHNAIIVNFDERSSCMSSCHSANWMKISKPE